MKALQNTKDWSQKLTSIVLEQFLLGYSRKKSEQGRGRGQDMEFSLVLKK